MELKAETSLKKRDRHVVKFGETSGAKMQKQHVVQKCENTWLNASDLKVYVHVGVHIISELM